MQMRKSSSWTKKHSTSQKKSDNQITSYIVDVLIRTNLVKVTDEIVQLIIRQGNVVLVGSVDRLGTPNISPRYVMAILEDEKIVFADAYLNKTYANVKSWPKITVAIVDQANRSGFQLKGDAEEIVDPGVNAQAAQKLKELGFKGGPAKVWALNVKEIYSIEPSEKSKEPLISAYG